MSSLKYFERLERMDQLIRLKATGTAEEFAKKLSISRSVLMDHLRELRKLGATIEYSSYRRSYYYTKDSRLFIGFLDGNGNKIKGGGDFFISPVFSDEW